MYWKLNNIGPLKSLSLQDLRCNIVARNIVYHARKGTWTGSANPFIDDERIMPRIYSPGLRSSELPGNVKRSLVQWATRLWPADKLDKFNAYGVFMWFYSLNDSDSKYVREILRKHYGYVEQL